MVPVSNASKKQRKSSSVNHCGSRKLPSAPNYCHISIFSALSELPDFMGEENPNEYIELIDGTPTIGRCLEVHITDVRPVFRLVIINSVVLLRYFLDPNDIKSWLCVYTHV
jgi:hypothetical protein